MTAALLVLQRIDGLGAVERLADLPAAARSTAISFLASRAKWSGQLLDAVESGAWPARHRRDHRGSAA